MLAPATPAPLIPVKRFGMRETIPQSGIDVRDAAHAALGFHPMA
jgi:hypothetical protein